MKDSKSVKDLVTKTLNPQTLKIRVKQIREIKDGLLIKVNNDDDNKVLEEAIKANNALQGLKVEKPKKKNPRIFLKGIPKDIEEVELVRLIKSQNEHVKGAIKICFGMKNGAEVNHWVLEVDPEDFGRIMRSRVLTLNWLKVRVTEHVSVMQCFRCLEFGHKQAESKAKQACLKCGKGNHTVSECKSKTPKCVNCSRYNREQDTNYENKHTATSIVSAEAAGGEV